MKVQLQHNSTSNHVRMYVCMCVCSSVHKQCSQDMDQLVDGVALLHYHLFGPVHQGGLTRREEHSTHTRIRTSSGYGPATHTKGKYVLLHTVRSMYVNTYAHTYVCTYIRTYIHTYIHTYIENGVYQKCYCTQ